MNKLNYGTFDISNGDIAFASTNGYSNPSSELETRKQLSYPLKEVKTFVNNTVAVNSDDEAVQFVLDENNKLQYRTEPSGTLVDVQAGSSFPTGGTEGQLLTKNSATDGDVRWGDSVPFLTVAPTQANTVGVKLVYLESEPATKYSGYIYFIKE